MFPEIEELTIKDFIEKHRATYGTTFKREDIKKIRNEPCSLKNVQQNLPFGCACHSFDIEEGGCKWLLVFPYKGKLVGTVAKFFDKSERRRNDFNKK